MTSRHWLSAVRVAVSIVALVLVARWVDAGAVLARLGALQLEWVALALAVSVVQVGLLAWRWRFTAARLGLDLPLRDAWSEYYLGVLVNQVLPGGVIGDVSRAWRHARATTMTGPAVRAVILERVSAQVIMTLLAAISVLFLPGDANGSRSVWLAVGVVTVGVAALVALLLRADPDSHGGRLLFDARRACFARDALPFQFASGLLVVASYVAVFVIAALALGIQSPMSAIVPLVAPVLMTMLIPITVAGWGLREGAAAGLWSFAGLSAAEGATVSVTYGLLVLISSAPGLVVLAKSLSAGPGRRAHPPRE